MAKPVVVFPDAQLWAVGFLRAALELREEPYAVGVTVGTVLPYDGSVPYVIVRQYGASVDRFADGTAFLRVTVWHSSEARALALGQLLHGLLVAAPGDASVRFVSSESGPFPAADPDSSNPISSFTVSVRVRPTQLA